MNIICRVLKQYYLTSEKEEENMKKKIKDCLNDSKGKLIKILYHDVDLSDVYKEMNISSFGHLIAFYCFLETYDEIIVNKTKEEKKDLIVQLTLLSLDDFQRYKKNRLQEEKQISTLDNLFYTSIKTVAATCLTSTIAGVFDYFIFN